MDKREFMAVAKIMEISDADYAIIETVYIFHPSIKNTTGKAGIAAIYNLPGGMRIIRDMVPTARNAERIENEQLRIRHEIFDLNRKLERLEEERQNL